MNERAILEKLRALGGAFENELSPTQKEIAERTEKLIGQTVTIKEIVETIEEWFGHIRVSIKYQAFDLEATRREQEYLKKLMDGLEEENKKLIREIQILRDGWHPE